ncbi:MAG: NADH-quinone oxidoreductase subunit NuoG [Chloroflexi bacterium]|nr:NADH-quinone oxidoreductase subunit NuoG [Chloroflexota bacterium]
MTKQFTLTIDGVQVTVPEGTLVVDAAKLAGIDIPVFCYHPKMEPAGNCRMCLVEIGRPVLDRASGQAVMENGQPKIQFMPKLETACTNTVSEGMVVLTQTEKARDGQKGTLEFLLTSHPLDCPICDKGGECPLQNLTVEHGPGKSRFLYDEKLHFAKQVPLGELIWLDRERCIQCARCIRFQDEVVGEAVLGFEERGRSTQIISLSEPGFDSVFSGNTTDICPVGALTTADFRFGARPWELSASASICSQCPVGCNTTLNTRREAKAGGGIVVKRVMPRQNEEVNEIWMCDKGRFAHHYAESQQRLVKPSIRQAKASWTDAFELVTKNFESSRSDVVVLASGRLSNEDLFNLKSLADGLGGRSILYTDMGGGDLTALVGVGQGTDLGKLGKGDVLLVVASDLYEEAPIWYLRVKQAADRGATLIVANARATKLERFAKYAIRYANGDELKTIAGLHGDGKIAQEFANAQNAVVFYGGDGLGLGGTTDLAPACAKLLKDTNHIGRANNGLVGVWQRANDQGAWEMGFRPEADLASALKGRVVYIVGADPAGDDPALALALKGAKFIVAQDILETLTTQMADVVLPAQAYTEREGSYTSGERRVQRFYAAVPVRGEAKADFAIAGEIGRRLGLNMENGSARITFDRLAANLKDFAGLDYNKLAEVKPQWPIVGRGDLYYGGTTYENKQGLGVQLSTAAERGETVSLPEVRKDSALRPKEDELLAVPVTKLYDLGATVSSTGLLCQRIGAATISLHPEAAKRLGLEAGMRVALSFDGLGGEALVKIDDTISAGVALVPRSMGLAVREPVSVRVQILAEAKVN